ncbi:YihY/virulence factor BrkB family protein [Azospirillum halopraeferens]|uniref:YihY/virulence factor BrkB family protein n=1 Tax=Azospirillum halopraeferens TaxID=34010 RepID=UPI0004289D14|nr:YihY/virulence factor BrkB family protein [Azospirillum halopraeferens]
MLGLSRRHHDRYPRVRSGRGRDARTPAEIPKRGWKDILWRVYEQQAADNLFMISGGVAYYALLAMFPAIAAAVSIYGLVADPTAVETHVEQLAGILPDQALEVLRQQAESVASASGGGLTVGAIGGLLLALWSASRGVNSLVIALNIVYDEEETRGFVRLAALSLVLTVAGILFLVFTLAVVVVVPAILAMVPLGGLEPVVRFARWPILAAAVMVALAVLYRYAPCRREPKWRWVTWGSVLATVLWLLGSAGFSIYVTNFASYNETYGSVGAAVILLLWLNLTSYVVLLGGELNAEMEHQTVQDTTDAPSRPMGQREAYVADTVGRRRA